MLATVAGNLFELREFSGLRLLDLARRERVRLRRLHHERAAVERDDVLDVRWAVAQGRNGALDRMVLVLLDDTPIGHLYLHVEDAWGQAEKTKGVPGLAIATYVKGQPAYLRGFGNADNASGTWMDTRHVGNLASISKAVAATTLFNLSHLGCTIPPNADTGSQASAFS